MIYITGFNFNFNPRAGVNTARGSIQEQMAIAKRQNITPKPSSLFDDRFIVGNTYRVANIQKVLNSENKPKIRYLFANMTDASQPDIDVLFDDTGRADEYIAAISGQAYQLQEERKNIAATYQTNDF